MKQVFKLFILGYLSFSCERKAFTEQEKADDAAPTFKAAKVTPAVYQPLFETFGTVQSEQKPINLSFKQSGILQNLSFDVGATFSKGQLLASLDQTELLLRKQTIKRNYEAASTSLQRTKNLYDDGLVTQEQLENEENRVNALQNDLKTINYQLATAHVKAPFDGIITEKLVTEGEIIGAGQPVLRAVPKAAEYRLHTYLSEAQMLDLANLERVEITLSTSKNERFSAKVHSVAEVPNAGNMAYETILHYTERPEILGKIKSGFTGKAHFTLKGDSCFSMHASALHDIQHGTASIYLFKNESMVKEKVSLLAIQDDVAYVRGELSEQDRVITSGAGFIQINGSN